MLGVFIPGNAEVQQCLVCAGKSVRLADHDSSPSFAAAYVGSMRDIFFYDIHAGEQLVFRYSWVNCSACKMLGAFQREV